MRGAAAQRIVDLIRKPRNNADEAIAPKPGGTAFPGDLLCRAARPWGPAMGFASLRAAHPGKPPSRGHAGLIQRFLRRLRPAHAVDARAGQYLHNSREPVCSCGKLACGGAATMQ